MHMLGLRHFFRISLALILLTASGCATRPLQSSIPEPAGLTDPDFYEGMDESFSTGPGQPSFIDVYDPWGAINRRLYVFNTHLDDYVLLPAVRVYRFAVPEFIRTGITNFFVNLGEISTFVNSLLQFKGEKAATTAARFCFNSTIGLLGLLDVASHMELPKQDEDLGQTLSFYGVDSGPYLVLPLFGPSSLRDASGIIGDFTLSREANLFGVRKAIWTSIPLTTLDVIQIREGIPFSYGDLSSPFEYELVRYLYQESRKFKSQE